MYQIDNQIDNDFEQQYIHIIISSTTTKLGKLIQYVTRYQYNHVSLALGSNYDKIYSFARYQYCSPLVGGFVKESLQRYAYKSNKTVKIKVFRIPVSNVSYQKINKYIDGISHEKEQYIYNTVSALAYPIKKMKPIYKAFTCIEFVNHILDISKINIKIGLHKNVSIKTLDEQLSDYCIYEGDVLKLSNTTSWGNDEYQKKIPLFQIYISTIQHFNLLLYRMVRYK